MGSAVGCGFAAGLNTTEGLEFAAGVLNAPGEADYPSWLSINVRSPGQFPELNLFVLTNTTTCS